MTPRPATIAFLVAADREHSGARLVAGEHLMSEIERIGDIEIYQDMAAQQREWAIRRVGWAAMLLFVLAGLAGLLGPGPLSRRVAGTRDSALWAEYNRFERRESPSVMRIHLGAGATHDGKARLSLNRYFIEHVHITGIDPEPEAVEAGADRFTYVFTMPDAALPTTATFRLEPSTYWRMPVRVWLDGGPRQLRFEQFYFP